MIEIEILKKYKKLMIREGYSKGHSEREIRILKNAIEMFGLEYTPEDIREYSLGCTDRSKMYALQRFYFWHHRGVLNAPRVQQNIGFTRPRCTKQCYHNSDGICIYDPEEFIENAFTITYCGYFTSKDDQENIAKQWMDVTKKIKTRAKKIKGKVHHRDSHSIQYWGEIKKWRLKKN